MSQYDTESLYQFLTTTPEKGLRSMLIDKQFSEIHLNLLMKVVRACTQEQFSSNFSSQMMPKIRTNDKEDKIKEKFWKDCEACMLSRGLLFPAGKKVVKENKEAA